jgi:bromodomain-containing factor 1
MFLTANESMIDIQRNIVEMIQKTLIEKAREAQSARAKAKSEKPKKASKSAKTKTAGAGGRKSTGGAGQSKKTGGSKKAAPKKSLTAAEKDQIANAINDLDGPHLDRAIDIIKRDTGQNVSDEPNTSVHCRGYSRQTRIYVY